MSGEYKGPPQQPIINHLRDTLRYFSQSGTLRATSLERIKVDMASTFHVEIPEELCRLFGFKDISFKDISWLRAAIPNEVRADTSFASGDQSLYFGYRDSKRINTGQNIRLTALDADATISVSSLGIGSKVDFAGRLTGGDEPEVLGLSYWKIGGGLFVAHGATLVVPKDQSVTEEGAPIPSNWEQPDHTYGLITPRMVKGLREYSVIDLVDLQLDDVGLDKPREFLNNGYFRTSSSPYHGTLMPGATKFMIKKHPYGYNQIWELDLPGTLPQAA